MTVDHRELLPGRNCKRALFALALAAFALTVIEPAFRPITIGVLLVSPLGYAVIAVLAGLFGLCRGRTAPRRRLVIAGLGAALGALHVLVSALAALQRR